MVLMPVRDDRSLDAERQDDATHIIAAPMESVSIITPRTT
jgi:hypothetical protein